MLAKKIIFAIDDDESMLDLYEFILGDLYNLICFKEVDGLLKQADNLKPDLVIIDIGLGEMDGYQLCEELKLKHCMEEVPVIYVTGRDFSRDKGKAFFSGGADYVTKPIEMQSFRAIVDKHLKVESTE